MGGVPLLTRTPVINARAAGAVGDGATDDSDALERALEQAGERGGTLYLPPGRYSYRRATPLRPAAGVVVAGHPGDSVVEFAPPPSRDGFGQLWAVTADDVTLDGVVSQRASDVATVLVDLEAVRGFTLSRSALLGRPPSGGTTYCHGIKLPDSGSARALTLTDSTFAELSYGLLQTNVSTARVDAFTVERCNFSSNGNTDLEFNSPRGTTTSVRVTDCAFADHESLGFGIGLANVTGAVVERNTFERYSLEAVHIEDYSTSITIRGNTFTACGLREFSHVQIIGGSNSVTVADNVFTATMNTQRIYVVNALPGGTAPTPGGRPVRPPTAVTVRANSFACAPPVVPVYFEGVSNGVITANVISGAALRSAADAFRLLDDQGTTLSANKINGTTN